MPTNTHAIANTASSLGQLFAYPFRVFFLSLTLLAIAVVPAWVMIVSGQWQPPLAMPGIYWHQHEMLFGFLSAAIAGFLLTAVCVWTQTERSHGARLLALWLVWLAGRGLLSFGGDLPDTLVQGVNLAFLPLVMVDAGWRVWRTRQWRQLMILVVLGLLWAMQAGFVLTLQPVFIDGALIMALALIGIIGGRITPAFTRNWLRQQHDDGDAVKMRPWLDRAVLINLVALLATTVAGLATVSGVLAIPAALLTLIRLAGWQGWRTRGEPLLWVLHLSILWVPVALALFAGHQLLAWPGNASSHAAGTGAIACLILGVMARVALGHTGRPLTLPQGLVTAFLALQLAAVLRVLTALGTLPWHPGIGTATVLWCLAFGLFLWRYGSILASPRADGRPG